ncbi:MAG: CPBP family intramembrane metalloprotease [Phycisphaerales bacterium]|nr:CPBP family intramembrane metalloprotease [Phycisphaerales bacterium]
MSRSRQKPRATRPKAPPPPRKPAKRVKPEAPPEGPPGYAEFSKRPLHVLAFLAPLLVLYEFGSLFLMSQGDGVGVQLRAPQVMGRVFESLGVASVHLPAIALVVVLLAWHLLKSHPWRIRPGVLLKMAGESLVWTVPLLALSVVLFSPTALAAREAGSLWDLPWFSRLIISIGAGLYEEMLFRLILITLLHALLVDLLGMKDLSGKALAVVASALAFAAIHEPVEGPDAWRLRSYYFLTGIYFGVLFVQRGLGIAVGAHALYDAIVLLAPPGSGD